MNLFQFVLYLHIASAIFSGSFFALRYWWMHQRSALFDARWVRVLPHCVDSTLLLSGVALMVMTRYYPFTEEGEWLTEKLFGVIIYIFRVCRAWTSSSAQPAERVCCVFAGADGVVHHR